MKFYIRLRVMEKCQKLFQFNFQKILLSKPTVSILLLTPFFRRVQTFVQNLTRKWFFSNEEFHIILKRRNLEICEHSSFSIIDKIVF